jgi:hypothetical protein
MDLGDLKTWEFGCDLMERQRQLDDDSVLFLYLSHQP